MHGFSSRRSIDIWSPQACTSNPPDGKLIEPYSHGGLFVSLFQARSLFAFDLFAVRLCTNILGARKLNIFIKSMTVLNSLDTLFLY